MMPRRRRTIVFSGFLAMVSCLVVLACSHEPPQVAPGLTQKALSDVTIGMSETTAHELMGEPLFRTVGEDEEATLYYATLGGWKVAGMAGTLTSEGVGCWLEFESDGLSAAVLLNADENSVCGCDQRRCPDNWTAECVEGLGK